MIFTVASLLCALAGIAELSSTSRARCRASAARSCSPPSLALLASAYQGARPRHRVRRLGRDHRRRGGGRPAGRRRAHRRHRLGGDLPRQPADRDRRDRARRSRRSRSRTPRAARASTGPAPSRSPARCSRSIFGLIRGNAEGWGSALILACLAGAVVLLDRLRGRRAPQPTPDARPLAVPQARVRRRLDRRLRAVGVDVLDVPLPDALHPEHPRLLAARVRPALPAGHAALVHRRADLGQARRAPRRPLVPRRRARCSSASGCCSCAASQPGDDWTALLAGFLLAGAGIGLVNPALATAAVGVVEPQRAGMASGINSTFRQVGIATGIAALGAIFQHVVAQNS